jgi:hypothetical protein
VLVDIYATYSTFLASNQLTTHIHWPWDCTVHVYVIGVFFWGGGFYCCFFWVFLVCAVFLGGSEFVPDFFNCCLWMYCRWKFNYLERAGTRFYRFSPHFNIWPKTWYQISIVVNDLRWELLVCFADIYCIVQQNSF